MIIAVAAYYFIVSTLLEILAGRARLIHEEIIVFQPFLRF